MTIAFRTASVLLVALVVAASLLAPAASAHESRVIGDCRVTLGWGVEPAHSGAANLVALMAREAGRRGR